MYEVGNVKKLIAEVERRLAEKFTARSDLRDESKIISIAPMSNDLVRNTPDTVPDLG